MSGGQVGDAGLVPVDMVMPMFTETMEEGTIVSWLKEPGDEVAVGDDLVEIETDKATMVYESDTSGVLLEILAEVDATVPISTVIARVGAAAGTAPRPARPASAADSGVFEARARGRSVPSVSGAHSAKVGSSGRRASGRVNASPTARHLAERIGVDLTALRGTGPGGRIVESDVKAASDTEESERPQGEVRVLDLSPAQLAATRRLGASTAEVPQFDLAVDVDFEAAFELLAEYEPGINAPAPTVGDLVIRIAAVALREHPLLNGSYRDGEVETYSRINVGFAVSTERGLLVPVVFDADTKSLGEIAYSTTDLIARTRSGGVTPQELSGGTFTVSNLGMFGIDRFTAIINPPQSAILAVGRARNLPVSNAAGDVAVRRTLTSTLSCDHRVMQGTDGASFLSRFRELLEDPAAHAG